MVDDYGYTITTDGYSSRSYAGGRGLAYGKVFYRARKHSSGWGDGDDFGGCYGLGAWGRLRVGLPMGLGAHGYSYYGRWSLGYGYGKDNGSGDPWVGSEYGSGYPFGHGFGNQELDDSGSGGGTFDAILDLGTGN